MKALGIFGLCFASLLPASVFSAGFDVKGVPLGASQDELLRIVGSSVKCSNASAGAQQQPAPDLICEPPMGALGPLVDSFAGIPVSIRYELFDGRVGLIRVAPIHAQQYETTLETMTSKYGIPKVQRGEIQNKFGAKMDDARATWERDGDAIQFDKHNPVGVDFSLLRFMSKDYMSKLRQIEETNREKAKSDM